MWQQPAARWHHKSVPAEKRRLPPGGNASDRWLMLGTSLDWNRLPPSLHLSWKHSNIPSTFPFLTILLWKLKSDHFWVGIQWQWRQNIRDVERNVKFCFCYVLMSPVALRYCRRQLHPAQHCMHSSIQTAMPTKWFNSIQFRRIRANETDAIKIVDENRIWPRTVAETLYNVSSHTALLSAHKNRSFKGQNCMSRVLQCFVHFHS